MTMTRLVVVKRKMMVLPLLPAVLVLVLLFSCALTTTSAFCVGSCCGERWCRGTTSFLVDNNMREKIPISATTTTKSTLATTTTRLAALPFPTDTESILKAPETIRSGVSTAMVGAIKVGSVVLGFLVIFFIGCTVVFGSAVMEALEELGLLKQDEKNVEVLWNDAAQELFIPLVFKKLIQKVPFLNDKEREEAEADVIEFWQKELQKEQRDTDAAQEFIEKKENFPKQTTTTTSQDDDRDNNNNKQ